MYYLYYKLSIIEPKISGIDSMVFDKIEDIKTSNKDFMNIFDYDLKNIEDKENFVLTGYGYWNGWSKEMRTLSKAFPQAVFKLCQVDEEDEKGNQKGCNFFFFEGHLAFKTEF